MQYFSTIFTLLGSASSNSITSSKLCSYLQSEYAAYVNTPNVVINKYFTAIFQLFLGHEVTPSGLRRHIWRLLGKSSVSEHHFFLNIKTVIDNIIIKKGINYFLSDGNSTARSMYYLHLPSVNDRRHSLKLTLKFRYGTLLSDC